MCPRFFYPQVPPETETVEEIILEEKEHIFRIQMLLSFFLGRYTSITEGI